MFPYPKLQSAMTRLRFKDETALRELGLAKLIKAYDAYPLVEDGQRIFVLLPRGMDPQAAQKLEIQTAARSVVVLSRVGKAVAKLWPAADTGKAAARHQPGAAQAEADGPSDDIEIVEE